MRALTPALAVVSFLGLSLATPAQSIDLYGHFGLTTIAADDLDDVYEGIENSLATIGLAADFSGPSNGMDISVGVRQQFHPLMSLGIEVGATFDNLTNNSSNFFIDYTNRASTSVKEMFAILEFHLPDVPLLHLGIGAGFATATHDFRETIKIDPENSPPEFFETKLEADGSGPSFMVFAGIETPDPTGVFLIGRVGYRHRDLGDFSGTWFRDGQIISEGPVLGQDGEKLNFDLSGLFGHVGIGKRFGVEGPERGQPRPRG